MSKQEPPLGAPARVLVLRPRTAAPRAELAALAWPGAVVQTAAISDAPAPQGYDAIVVDGDGGDAPAGWIEQLRSTVLLGASLVVLGGAFPGQGARDGAWSGLVGVDAGDPVPFGEVFARAMPGAEELTGRLPEEFPVVDSFRPLHGDASWTSVLQVSIGFVDRDAVLVRAFGSGRVLVSGLGLTAAAFGSPELAQVLRRALGRRLNDLERPFGVGIVGYGPYGGMGLYHGLGVQATAGLEFVAVCDSNADRRKAAEAEFAGVRTYATADELAQDDDVALVVVGTPPSSHMVLSLAFLRSGKHVACEKPLCFTTEETDTLISAAEEAGVTLTVHQSRRWDADYRAIRRAVDDGLLGDLFNTETFVGGFEHPCREWHSEESISGGAVYDWGSHHLDWILQLMGGQPSSVTAVGHKRVWHDVTNLDQIRVRLAWPDGREAEFLQSDVAAVRRPKFYLQGTTGTLVGHYRPLAFERLEPGRGFVAEYPHHAEAPADLVLANYQGANGGVVESRLPPAPEARFAFHTNLADHLHRREPLAVTPASVRKVVAVLEASVRSAASGGTPVQPAEPLTDAVE